MDCNNNNKSAVGNRSDTMEESAEKPDMIIYLTYVLSQMPQT